MRLTTFSSITMVSLLSLVSVQAADKTDMIDTTQNAGILSDFSSEENEELIVAVLYRKQESLSDGMFAYVINGDIALPLEQLMLLVEFPIKLSADAMSASGWFIRENRHFSLDLTTGKVISDGKQFDLLPSQVRIEDGELFVPTALLSEWFPLEIKANLRALDVTVIPKENTAIDERIERKTKRFGTVYQVYAKHSEHHTPYQAFSIPSVSASFGVGYNEAQDLGANSSISLRAYGDIAYMAGELALIGDSDELTDARFSLSRRNLRGGLLGGLNATEVELGDIVGTSLPLISNNSSGRGVHIARRPAGYVGNQETTALSGILEPGYSVELYRNNILINAKQSGTGTEYEFLDLTLFAGQNEFRLEFYGPQGQRSTQTKRFYVGAGQLKQGEINYDISLAQPNKTLFDVGDNSTSDRSTALSANLDYGVRRNLTISAGLASIPLDDSGEYLRYGLMGLSSELAGISGKLDVAVDEENGHAWSLKATTDVNDIDLSANYTQYNDGFTSNRTLDDTSGRQIAATLGVSADIQSIKLGKKNYFSLGFRANQNEFTDDEWSREYSLNVSGQIKPFMVANNLTYNHYSDDINDSLSGQLQLNTRLGKLQLRLSSSYELKPDEELQHVSAGLSYPFKQGYQASLSFTEDHIDNTQSLIASVSKQFKFMNVGLSASQISAPDEDDEMAVYLTASLNTFTDPQTRQTTFDQGHGITGASRVTAFLDENQDGLFNVGEETIPDITIRGKSRAPIKTDENGQALILTSFFSDWTDINMDNASVIKAGFSAPDRGRAVLNRPGVVSEIHLPVYQTGTAEGIVILSYQGTEKTNPLSNLEVQAMQKESTTGNMKVVATTYTAYDGFYSLPDIPVGDIQLRINPEQLKRLAIHTNPVINLVFDAENNFIEGQDFKFIR